MDSANSCKTTFYDDFSGYEITSDCMVSMSMHCPFERIEFYSITSASWCEGSVSLCKDLLSNWTLYGSLLFWCPCGLLVYYKLYYTLLCDFINRMCWCIIPVITTWAPAYLRFCDDNRRILFLGWSTHWWVGGMSVAFANIYLKEKQRVCTMHVHKICF